MWNSPDTVMGGGHPVKVVNCPSQDLALSNHAFVNPADAAAFALDAMDHEQKGFVEISGNVLSVRYPFSQELRVLYGSGGTSVVYSLILDACLMLLHFNN